MTVLSPTPPKTELITGKELIKMADVGPCELIDGRIVPMTPTGAEHGLIEFNLGSKLQTFVQTNKLGWVMGGETGLYTQHNPDRIRAADIIFLSRERSSERPGPGFLDIAPDLIVEIMSPSDNWQDVHLKIEEYFAIGVDRVWVVEPKNRAIRIFSSPVKIQKLAETDTLKGEGVLSGFTLVVADIFAD